MDVSLDLPHGMQAWEQLTLFEPEAVSVEMILHISNRGLSIDGGVRATELLTGACLHTEAMHWAPTLGGIAQATSRYHRAAHYWARTIWSAPYREGGHAT